MQALLLGFIVGYTIEVLVQFADVFLTHPLEEDLNFRKKNLNILKMFNDFAVELYKDFLQFVYYKIFIKINSKMKFNNIMFIKISSK